jgi:hypothetical protein
LQDTHHLEIKAKHTSVKRSRGIQLKGLATGRDEPYNKLIKMAPLFMTFADRQLNGDMKVTTEQQRL